MATYVFICSTCKQTKQVNQSINEPEPTIICSTCKQSMTRKFGIQTIKFKGTGWGKD